MLKSEIVFSIKAEAEDAFDEDVEYPKSYCSGACGNCRRCVPPPPPLSRTMSRIDADILERQELTCLSKELEDTVNEGYITQMDPDGNIKSVPAHFNEESLSPVEDGMVNSIADFMSADILTKPFNFVSGK